MGQRKIKEKKLEKYPLLKRRYSFISAPYDSPSRIDLDTSPILLPAPEEPPRTQMVIVESIGLDYNEYLLSDFVQHVLKLFKKNSDAQAHEVKLCFEYGGYSGDNLTIILIREQNKSASLYKSQLKHYEEEKKKYEEEKLIFPEYVKQFEARQKEKLSLMIQTKESELESAIKKVEKLKRELKKL